MKNNIESIYLENNPVNNKDLDKYFKNNNFFGSSFIINMKDRIDKWTQASKILKNLKLYPIKFNAIIGKDITNEYILQRTKNLSPGERGCLISHLIILYLANRHENGDGFTLIFEDDITTNIQSIQSTFDKLKYHTNDIDMIYLGKCLEHCMEMGHIKDNIYKGYAPLCGHAYAIRNSYVEKIFNYLETQEQYDPIDLIYKKLMLRKECETLVLHPSIFNQDLKFSSDLRDKIQQIYTSADCILPENNNNSQQTWNVYLIIIIFLLILAFIFTYILIIKNY